MLACRPHNDGADTRWQCSEAQFGDDAGAEKARSGRVRQSVRYRQWPTQSGRAVDAHAATRNAGGARIVSPRAKVSTMLITAPQCGQTKVGGRLATRATSGVGAAVVIGTCSSSRA